MKLLPTSGRSKQWGFSLLEMMVSVVILTLVMAGVFSQLNTAQQRAAAEQPKVDDLQEVRDFVDQFFRDINQIGDPNSRMFDTTSGSWSPALASPLVNDLRMAVGLVKIDANEMRFEGSVNGVGTVQTIVYKINGSGTCGQCMQRSQADKVTASPVTGQSTNWGTEINDVVTTPIFRYFDTTGTEITALPVDISTVAGAQTIASVKTIQINLRVSNPSVVDRQTGAAIQTSFQGEVSLNNCSMASTGFPMSCN